jgi:hypothetical protein
MIARWMRNDSDHSGSSRAHLFSSLAARRYTITTYREEI